MEKKWLKVSVWLQWVVLIGGLIIGFFEETNLPKELKAYIGGVPERPYDFIVVTLGIIFLIAYAVASVGIYRLKRTARKYYLYANICGFFLAPFAGLQISGPITTSLSDLNTLFIGLTLGLLYFSPIRESFK